MAYTSSANPTAVTALLTQNNFITADAKFANFGTSLNQRNPFYEVQIDRLGDVNNVASNSLLSFYEGNGDPRSEKVYRPNTAATPAYIALPQGAGVGLTGSATAYSRPGIGATSPVYLMTVSESNFLQAEALIRYAAGTGAKAKYDSGVQASFATYGLSLTAADPFLAVGGAYEYQPEATIEQTVRQVIVQKWASLAYVNSIEAYIETTRTKFPEVVAEGSEDYTIGNRIPSRASILGGVSIPTILYYPDDEVNRNPNIVQHSSLTDKVWWDQK